MNKQEFEGKYKDDIPQGRAMQYSLASMEKLGHPRDFSKHDTSHDVSIVNGADVRRLGHFTHAHYAEFVEDLINAYRAGELVWSAWTVFDGSSKRVATDKGVRYLCLHGFRHHWQDGRGNRHDLDYVERWAPIPEYNRETNQCQT